MSSTRTYRQLPAAIAADILAAGPADGIFVSITDHETSARILDACIAAGAFQYGIWDAAPGQSTEAVMTFAQAEIYFERQPGGALQLSALRAELLTATRCGLTA